MDMNVTFNNFYTSYSIYLRNTTIFNKNFIEIDNNNKDDDDDDDDIIKLSIANLNVTSLMTTINNVTNDSDSNTNWEHFYDLLLSWQGICLIAVFCTFIIITIIGNTLVILAIITTRRLKTVTNCFVMSLAIADLLVGIFVMPPAVAVHLIGSWQLGWILCDIWISLDVLLCTASILSLCAISIDRYLAVTQPLRYSRKRRSKRLALIMIFIVWSLALAITCPPMLGWYEPGRRNLKECRYNQNEGYVIFSAMGSFFIPMTVMIYVYARISCVIASRHDNMTDIGIHKKKLNNYNTNIEADHDLSELELNLNHQRKSSTNRLTFNQIITMEESNDDIITISDVENGSALRCHTLLLNVPNTKQTDSKNNSNSLNKNQSNEDRKIITKTLSSKLNMNNSWTCSTIICCSSHDNADLSPSSSMHHSKYNMTNTSMNYHQEQRRSSCGTIEWSDDHEIEAFEHKMLPSSISRQSTQNQHQHQHHIKTLSKRIILLKKENKTTQTLSIVVGGFIACWLPFFMYYLITPFLDDRQVSRTLSKTLTWLGWFNSAINPFIYAFYSVDFRVAFWRLTFKHCYIESEHQQQQQQQQQLQTNTISIKR